MKLLAVHPSGLMYTRVFLRLEPLGLESVAAVARDAGHDVRLVDLQVESHRDLMRVVRAWRPDALCFSGNYLANIPEIVDLSKAVKAALPSCFVFVGGHSVSFTANDLLRHADGAIDCVLRGEGEASIVPLLDAAASGASLLAVPGVLTTDGAGPPPRFVEDLDRVRPARDLLRHRRKYFIGTLDPCASIEFARGCPWDCTFCSAWTFYGRSYRSRSPEVVVDELASIREPGVFIVDDVAFVHADHGIAIGEAIRRRGIDRRYYLETRGDVLLRNKDVFRLWASLGLKYMFLGMEAIDEEGLKAFRKRISLDRNFEALAFARSLGITVAINLIADPDWDHDRFETIRQWCLDIPEIVNISVNTPYPGTENWQREARELTSLDYRLYDIQHAVLPTKLPLPEFYAELVRTQQVLNRKHLGWAALRGAAGQATRLLLRGQTNFVRMLWRFNSVFDPRLQLADHGREVRYAMTPPPAAVEEPQRIDMKTVYIHGPAGRKGRVIDDATEKFVDETRMGTG
ncbi:hopanoid C-3 methylase HpnR [Paraburkholderia caballeronis]|uniref:Hopanoid C-3 methylase HpnR n=1 Tax=Paraburkholderia caballeronis TaxID=416943 RepID=A0A1H7S9X2_9BURK|nr:hopanoid C-3 methylase HpnR [Paraburkholderia caballeronis]PXW22976.1 hopanoid C-3 methylase HpnR [Paraburkholderia caballeronis]PXW97361.1 hopanoid C-3 methylase HpnR [Paraburkholderia caballeronis]RAJ93881.1 hopanoid C-3 methylase HpnR [Paraburkholderia caballeronis]SED53906.1 hopanoid C-3 methylase HpnR [Paraburkholderia caballeronis]SEL69345.1 hopanoid C-3 methylase HpnR [Paraburkholderia caballeronis]